jgi:hypothetical protein
MESYLIGIGCSFGLAAIIAFFWVRGIDYMQKNHPDYKGEDFLDWNIGKPEKSKQQHKRNMDSHYGY